eukprot:10562658-Karenia_brevis.AAC.1
MVATLSAVDQGALHRFNAVGDNVCIFCRSCPSSVHHCIWHCSHPELVDARRNTTDDLEVNLLQYLDCLPLPLLYGLPPKMALLPCGPWWSNEPIARLQDNSITRSFREFIGMDACYPLGDPMVQWLSDYTQYDARTAFRHLTGDGVLLEDPPMPPFVHGTPPEAPNSFSDGSFTNPRKPVFGLATAAVWWP